MQLSSVFSATHHQLHLICSLAPHFLPFSFVFLFASLRRDVSALPPGAPSAWGRVCIRRRASRAALGPRSRRYTLLHLAVTPRRRRGNSHVSPFPVCLPRSDGEIQGWKQDVRCATSGIPCLTLARLAPVCSFVECWFRSHHQTHSAHPSACPFGSWRAWQGMLLARWCVFVGPLTARASRLSENRSSFFSLP
jgi:hypothetical protein